MAKRAPKICGKRLDGRSCSKLVDDGGKYCDEHRQSGWSTHPTTKPWAERKDGRTGSTLRAYIFARDGYRCRIDGPSCTWSATHLDRIDNSKGYTRDNCQAACGPCNQWKASYEGHAARGHATDAYHARLQPPRVAGVDTWEA